MVKAIRQPANREGAIVEISGGNGRPRLKVGRGATPEFFRAAPAGTRPLSGRQLSPLEAFDRYATEKRLAPATIKRWRAVAAKIQDEHPHMADITDEWCKEWIYRLFESGLSSRTIRNNHLAGLRLLCRWAVANGAMAADPTDGITVRTSRKMPTRYKGFLDAEARTILAAALEPAPKSLPQHQAAARRWIPWLCAYFGARLGEVARLRGSEIRKIEGVWVVLLASEDGLERRPQSRIVPLHPHLIEQGFPDFVKESGDGPLFYNPERQPVDSDDIDQTRTIGKRLSRWIRELGVDDPNVSPSRGWRYRFMEATEMAEMDMEIRDYILGRHSVMPRKKFFDHYPPELLLREISRLPRIEIAGA